MSASPGAFCCGKRKFVTTSKPPAIPPVGGFVMSEEAIVVVLGLILLVLGLVLGISILYYLGAILLVVGVVLFALGASGRAVGPRRHYW